MKHNLLVIVIAFVGLLCPAWAGADAGPGYGSPGAYSHYLCSFTATVNNQATNYQFKVGTLRPFFDGMKAEFTGFNTTTNAFIAGWVFLSTALSFLNWNEYPNASFQFSRIGWVPIRQSFPWLGFVKDNGNLTGNVSFNSGGCTPE